MTEMPVSYGAERYLVTSILNKPDTIIDICNQVGPEDFSSEFYGNVFRVCLNMVEKEMVPEPMSVFNFLERAGLAEPKHLKELELLKKATYDSKNITGYIDDIRAVATRRKLIEAQEEAIQELQSKDLPPEEAISLCETKLLDISSSVSKVVDVYQIGSSMLEVLEERANNPLPVAGLPTGFSALDRDLQGLQNGRLYVLGARQKTGKSMWLLNVAANLGIGLDVPILMIDTELPSYQQDDRFLSLVSEVEESRIKNGMFADDKSEYESLKKATATLANSQIYHHYMPNFTFEACLSLAKRYKAQKDIGLLVFDYIKVPDDTEFRSVREDQSLGYLTSGLKNKIAGALDIPVLTAAQLGRRAIDAEEGTDDMVADSDRIGRYADVIMFLREKTEREKESYGCNEQTGNMVLTIQTSRYTNAKDVAYDIWFDKPRMKMTEVKARSRR